MTYPVLQPRPTLTHSNKRVDALRYSRVECMSMMGTTKMTQATSPVVSSVGVRVASVAPLATIGIGIIGVLLLITGGGPPI